MKWKTQPAQLVLGQIGGTVLNREAVVQDSPGLRSAPWESEQTQCLRELRRSFPKGAEDVWTTSSRLISVFLLSFPGCASRPWAILDNRFAVRNVLPKFSPKEQSPFSNSSYIENGRVSKLQVLVPSPIDGRGIGRDGTRPLPFRQFQISSAREKANPSLTCQTRKWNYGKFRK